MLMAISIRVLFVVLAYFIGYEWAEHYDHRLGGLGYGYTAFLVAGLAFCLVIVDAYFQKKYLRTLVAVSFGIMVGVMITWFIVQFLTALLGAGDVLDPKTGRLVEKAVDPEKIIKPMVPLISLVICYFSVIIVLRTKDQFRFIIPYIDFSNQSRQTGGLLFDSSVLIDGRIVDICETGIVNVRIIIPQFVLKEMQYLADSADKLKRAKGRRGLDVVNKLQLNNKILVEISESDFPEISDVDAKLVKFAQTINGKVVTNDFNLNKVAQIESVGVININDLANALKPIVLPGEQLIVKVIKQGEEQGQGVGYLEDGTMVVIEQGRNEIGRTVKILVTSVLQTSAGRMIFGRKDG